MTENSENTPSFPRLTLILTAVGLMVTLLLLGRFCSSAAIINVTVNDIPLALHGAKTLDTAIRESGLPINPGDFISLRGIVLKRNEGEPFSATVNGEIITDTNFELHEGDKIIITDGKDIIEDFDTVKEELPYDIVVTGAGSICTFEAGKPGIIEQRTGRISGDETQVVLRNAESATATWHRPDVGNDMTVALTFDEGPSEYTSEILDVLAENNAQATFFCKGTEAVKHVDVVQREWKTNHQVASNTYNHTIDLNSTAEAVLEEVNLGFRAIEDALEGATVKRIVRFPNALLTKDMAATIAEEVDAVIGWDLDTGDWLETNTDEVYDTLLSVRAGDIVVLHDGGGNCSGTIEALRHALPKLKERGFTFITIDTMMNYPAKTQE